MIQQICLIIPPIISLFLRPSSDRSLRGRMRHRNGEDEIGRGRTIARRIGI